MENRPKVGVGLLIFKDGKILLGKRKSAHAPGVYCGTGGHLESGESVFDCAIRETREEAGIEIENLRFLCVGNYPGDEKHYINFGIAADYSSGPRT
jgi:8-oxo-dGTP diphosphatase